MPHGERQKLLPGLSNNEDECQVHPSVHLRVCPRALTHILAQLAHVP